MAELKLLNSAKLKDFSLPYFVAEINTSHGGSLDSAKDMITEAKKIGFDCVKFQSWTAESLYSNSFYIENPIAKRFFKKFSLSPNEIKELADFSKSINITFCSTPYTRDEVDFLLEYCNVPYIKVASMDLNNHNFLEYIAKKNSPIVLSTGMGEIGEIRDAVEIIENCGNSNLCLLHCVSLYPTEKSKQMMRNILGLRKNFPKYPIGFSDHSENIDIAIVATSFGACMIEKHFTLDKKKIGMDNNMATEPKEMALLIKKCKDIQISLGSPDRVLSKKEKNQRSKMRRSIVASRFLKKGETLKFDDLDVKRPGTGIPPSELNNLIGKKILKDIDKDFLISLKDISEG